MNIRKIPILFLVIVFLAGLLPMSSAVLAADVITFTGGELLGKPTDTSITINIVPDSNIEYYYEYGTSSVVIFTDLS